MRNDVQFMPFMRTILVESILFYLLCSVCSATGNIYVTPSASPADDFSLVMIDLNINPMARCLDGSPGSYYFSRGTGSGISFWSIHTMGGGWCTDIADCVERSKGYLGSSLGYGKGKCPDETSPVCDIDGGPNGMFSSNVSINPMMHNWNRVFINYCDGGSYAGALVEPVQVDTNTTLYFRGRYILDAVYTNLLEVQELAQANEVVIKGCSAGGLAVYLHLDYLAQRIHDYNPYTRVVGAPGAGFFLDIASFSGPYTYTPIYRHVFEMQNVTVNTACIKAHSVDQAWRCYMAPYVLPYISTPMFIVNSQADSWQAGNIMQLGCDPRKFDCSMSQVLRDSLHGAFLLECFCHVVQNIDYTWSNVRVQGQSMRDTFAGWYTGSMNVSTAVYDGVWGTNPTCPVKCDT